MATYMSGRVAVYGSGDTVEKFAFLAPLASAAMGTVGRAAAIKVGQTALGQGAKSLAGKVAESGAGKVAGKVAGKAKDFLGEDAGKKIGQAGAAMAQMQQQKQQAMQQQNQQMAEKAKAGSQITTGEPMDMAWRMLKGELQLPHQITNALRGDLTTLDRAHKMTDTNEGTLIEGIHPDMENVVKLLAEKHMGDMTPTKQRPITPLFYGPHH